MTLEPGKKIPKSPLGEEVETGEKESEIISGSNANKSALLLNHISPDPKSPFSPPPAPDGNVFPRGIRFPPPLLGSPLQFRRTTITRIDQCDTANLGALEFLREKGDFHSMKNPVLASDSSTVIATNSEPLTASSGEIIRSSEKSPASSSSSSRYEKSPSLSSKIGLSRSKKERQKIVLKRRANLKRRKSKKSGRTAPVIHNDKVDTFVSCSNLTRINIKFGV